MSSFDLSCPFTSGVGTSTDVSRYHGDYEHVFEATIAGVTIQSPQVRPNIELYGCTVS